MILLGSRSAIAAVPLACAAAAWAATSQTAKPPYDTFFYMHDELPKGDPGEVAPGHLIFHEEGVAIWRRDVLAFLARHLGK
jgi:hypothetical protein